MNKFLMRICTACFALILSSGIAAQTNFEKGYIIDSDGDTITGLVNNRKWDTHPDRIAFRESRESAVNWFTPDIIKGFGVGDLVFISSVVEVDVSPHKLHDLGTDSQFVLDNIEAFLQVIVRGDKSLFFHKDKNSKEYYFIERDGKIEWLFHKNYYHIVTEGSNAGRFKQTNKRYIGQLSLYFGNCPEVSNDAQTSSYSLSDLFKLFKDYYQKCGGNATILPKRVGPKSIKHLDLVASFTHTKMSFTGARLWLTDADFPANNDFTGGLGFEIRFPRSNYASSIYAELLYNSIKTKATYLFYDMGAYQTYKHTSFNMQYLHLKAMYQYNYSLGSSRLFANAGLGFGYMVYRDNLMVTERITPTQTTETYSLPISNDFGREMIRTLDPSMIIGVGSNYKRFTVRAQFEIHKGPSEMFGVGSSVKRFYFSLGYAILD